MQAPSATADVEVEVETVELAAELEDAGALVVDEELAFVEVELVRTVELAFEVELLLTVDDVLTVEDVLAVDLAVEVVVFLVVTRLTILPMPSSPQRYWTSARETEANANRHAPANCWYFMMKCWACQ